MAVRWSVAAVRQLSGEFRRRFGDLPANSGGGSTTFRRSRRWSGDISTMSDDDGSDFEDEGIEMIARKFRRIFKNQVKRRNFKDLIRENLKVEKEKKEAIVYFECKKRGHIRLECPFLNKLEKKAMVVTWDDSDEESSDE